MKNQITLNQEIKYFAVTAKCGHVRRKYYLPITFGVVAKDAKDGAKIARYIPRVKHDHQDAILNVKEVSYEEYLEIKNKNDSDTYLLVHSKKDQNTYCLDLSDRLIKEDRHQDEEYTRDERLAFMKKKVISSIHESRNSRFYC